MLPVLTPVTCAGTSYTVRPSADVTSVKTSTVLVASAVIVGSSPGALMAAHRTKKAVDVTPAEIVTVSVVEYEPPEVAENSHDPSAVDRDRSIDTSAAGVASALTVTDVASSFCTPSAKLSPDVSARLSEPVTPVENEAVALAAPVPAPFTALTRTS